MVGEELVTLGMHFDSFGSLYDPVLGLIVYLGIDFELVQEGLEIALDLDDYKAIIALLGEGQLFVAVSLAWWFSAFSTAW